MKFLIPSLFLLGYLAFNPKIPESVVPPIKNAILTKLDELQKFINKLQDINQGLENALKDARLDLEEVRSELEEVKEELQVVKDESQQRKEKLDKLEKEVETLKAVKVEKPTRPVRKPPERTVIVKKEIIYVDRIIIRHVFVQPQPAYYIPCRSR